MMIQISEEKKEKLSEMCGKALRSMGKMMDCLEALDDECAWDEKEADDMPERDDMGMRGGGYSRYGMRRGGGRGMGRGGRY